MRIPSELYRQSLALLTDFYQVTMAYAYWKTGTADREAVFHLSFRHNPFVGGFSVACGLEYAADWLRSLRFAEDDIAYLASLTSDDGAPMFEPAFLDYLRATEFACDVDAVPEGTVVFPHEPLVRVQGPIVQAQLLETALLNMVNFQTLIATKAARVCLAAQGEPVLEFGMRRAQGLDGALAASRAAYVGGCAATSNVLAGKLFGIPVKGTHAHSFVMLFDDETQAFKEYARAMPRNCVLLVDTYDTLEGVRHAVEVGRWLREQGHELTGVRLDSGDLAYLSKEARKILDAGGFPQTAIVASNDLDERLIQSLKDQGATISVWGVGTRLVTGGDQSALGGVYKLAAVRAPGGAWQHRIKLSEQAIKVSTPGVLQVRRYSNDVGFQADMIWDVLGPAPSAAPVMIDPMDPTRRKRITAGLTGEDLLRPIFRGGRPVWEPPPLADVRARARDQLARCHAGLKRFDNPHRYPVGLERSLYDLKTRLVLQARHAPE
jgi:nicotinate phosphoribosyltransferase